MLSTYVMAISAALFSACSALTWIYAVRHFDPSHGAEKPASEAPKVAA